MVTLRTGFGSPFGRKARIAVSVLGLDGKVKVEPASTQDPRRSDPPAKSARQGAGAASRRRQRRCSIRRSSSNISTCIAGGGRILPKETKARFDALRLEALADGILDASILHRLRGPLPAGREARAEMARPCRPARSRAGSPRSKPRRRRSIRRPTVGQITLACALGYRDFRFKGTWRKDHPRLVAWLDSFAARVPAFDGDHAAAGLTTRIRDICKKRPGRDGPGLCVCMCSGSRERVIRSGS